MTEIVQNSQGSAFSGCCALSAVFIEVLFVEQGENGDSLYIVEAGVCSVAGADGRTTGKRLGCAELMSSCVLRTSRTPSCG